MSEINYIDLQHSDFPNSVLTMNNFQDVTADMKTIVDQYYTMWNLGNFTGANALLTTYPLLKTMIINADRLNQLVDGLKAVQRLFKDDIQSYIHELTHNTGTYVPTKAYIKYDFVDYSVNGVACSYQCMVDNTPIGTLPTNESFFIKRTIQGEKGDPGTGLTNKNAWKDYIAYVVDDMVAYNNALWACTINNTNSTPTELNSSWSLIMKFSTDLLSFDNTGSSLTSTNVGDAIKELDEKIETLDTNVENNYYTKVASDVLLTTKAALTHTHTDKANKTASIYTTLYAVAWVGTGAPYTQTFSNNLIKVDSILDYDITNGYTTTLAQMDAFLDAKIIISSQGTGAVIFKALGTLPSINIPITLHIGE